jgi:hypothetical protein
MHIMNKMGTFLIFLACVSLISAQGKIDTLKIYDRADNLLYFLTYDYSADSALLGQSLYDRTGYFLKTIDVDNSGKRSFRDDNGDLYHYSISRTDGTRNYFDLYDRFNKPSEQRVCQGYYNQGGSAGLIEFFNLSGGLTHKMQYAYNGGQLARITVLDNAGVMSHYVDVHYKNGPNRVEEKSLSSSSDGLLEIRAGFQGLYVSFLLQSSDRVRIEAFDVRGKRVGMLLDRVFPAGPSRLFCSTRRAAFSGATGIYLIRVNFMGRLYFRKMIVLD